MESIKSIEVSSTVDEENLSYILEDDISKIEYELDSNSKCIRLIITEDKQKTEVIVPIYNISVCSIIR
jgi:hypothetical protein